MRLMIPSLLLLVPAPGDFNILVPAEFNLILAADSDVVAQASGFVFVEGPVWNPKGNDLVFSDIDGDRLLKWTFAGGASTFRSPSHNAKGNTRDLQGRLVTCEQGTRRVTRAGGGGVTPLVTQYNRQPLNSPNDVVVKSDGTIWFADPDYGLKGAPSSQPGNYVYRFDPSTGALQAVETSFNEPNGLCFSPDESRLYIGDSGTPHHIRKFVVNPDKSLTDDGVFTTYSTGVPDGMRCDEDGRLFASGPDDVQVFLADGTKIGTILIPQTVTNLCFGGPDRGKRRMRGAGNRARGPAGAASGRARNQEKYCPGFGW